MTGRRAKDGLQGGRAMRPAHLDLVRMVLDHQLLDADNYECGKVDDLEVEIAKGELRVTAILTGADVAARHLPRWLQPLARRVFGRRRVRIPWSEVYYVHSHVRLRSRAAHYGLNRSDRELAPWLSRLPRSR